MTATTLVYVYVYRDNSNVFVESQNVAEDIESAERLDAG